MKHRGTLHSETERPIMRLFIAVNFSDETRNQLLALRNELRSRAKGGNFSLPENLHLTLAFLGECDAKQTAAAKQAMNTVSFEPFTITIAGVFVNQL